MAIKKVTYKEPKNYFNDDMLKAAKEWDEKHGKSEKTVAEESTGNDGAAEKEENGE